MPPAPGRLKKEESARGCWDCVYCVSLYCGVCSSAGERRGWQPTGAAQAGNKRGGTIDKRTYSLSLVNGGNEWSEVGIDQSGRGSILAESENKGEIPKRHSYSRAGSSPYFSSPSPIESSDHRVQVFSSLGKKPNFESFSSLFLNNIIQNQRNL